MRRNLTHLIHVIKKNLLCEIVPCFFCFHLALFELFFWDDLLKLLQGDHSYASNPKKLMDQRWPHIVELNGLALQQKHQKLALYLNLQFEK